MAYFAYKTLDGYLTQSSELLVKVPFHFFFVSYVNHHVLQVQSQLSIAKSRDYLRQTHRSHNERLQENYKAKRDKRKRSNENVCISMNHTCDFYISFLIILHSNFEKKLYKSLLKTQNVE